MKLIKCPMCDHIIDLDNLDCVKELTDNTIIGCGLNESNFMPCDGCAHEHDPGDCREIREKNGWFKTRIKDMI